MKQTLTFFLISFAISVYAQDKTYPVPDYDNTPSLYDAAKNELVELDACTYVVGTRPKGLMGAEGALYFNGISSSVKINKDQAVFIVKLKPGTDPRTLMDLNQSKVNNHSGKREYVIYKKGTATAEGNNPTIDISFKKIGEGVYLVTPKTPLASGEYFFSLLENSKSRVAYCFSVK